MEEKKLRAVIYCRFSTAEQIDSSAMNAQSARLHEQIRSGNDKRLKSDRLSKKRKVTEYLSSVMDVLHNI